MRIDLPQCDFENCRRRFDGKCNSKEAFRYCKYQELRRGSCWHTEAQSIVDTEFVELIRQTQNEDGTYHIIIKTKNSDGYTVTIDAPRCICD